MLEEYPNLYADLSAINIPLRARILDDLKDQKQIHDKLMFGTDFPVPFSAYLTYGNTIKRKIEIEKIENPLDRYIELFDNYFDHDSSIYTNYKKLNII